MKTYQTYECEICGKKSKDAEEIKKCECNHYGLTIEEMQEWQQLQNDVKHKGQRVSITKNEESETDFDSSVENLLKFEEKHGLTKSLLKKIRQTM